MQHAIQTLRSDQFSRVWYMARGFGDRYTVVFTGYDGGSITQSPRAELPSRLSTIRR